MLPGLIKDAHSDHLINCLIPATVALHLSRDTREIGLLALFAWIVLQLLNRIITLNRQKCPHETWLSWSVILGLLLFNVRNIVLRDDYRGPVLVLLIGIGLLLGSQFSQRQWRNLLVWLAVSILPIGLFFTIQLGLRSDWSISSIFSTYYELVKPSMGSINRLATLSTFLTLAAWYSSTISRSRWRQAANLVFAVIGYWIVLGTDSRMAISAVPVAILLPWLGLRLYQRFSIKQWLSAILGATALLAVGAWEIVVKSGIESDTQRLRIASCWIRKGMFRSTERFWMGSGFNTDSISEACESIRPGNPFGHAHNTLAQIAGNHGLLGLIGLLAFTAVIVHGLWRQLPREQHRLDWSPWNSTEWGEISLGLNLALLFCALSTTVQEFSPVNQLLIGLVAGSACVAMPAEFKPGMTENRDS